MLVTPDSFIATVPLAAEKAPTVTGTTKAFPLVRPSMREGGLTEGRQILV